MTLRVVTTTGNVYDFHNHTNWRRKNGYLKIRNDNKDIAGYFLMENVDALLQLNDVEMNMGGSN